MSNVKVDYLRLNIPMERIIRGLVYLKRETKVSSFTDAIALIQIGQLGQQESDCVSLLITIWRACMDGEVEPLVDLEHLYAECELS